VVECPPSKHEALTLNPGAAKKKKKVIVFAGHEWLTPVIMPVSYSEGRVQEYLSSKSTKANSLWDTISKKKKKKKPSQKRADGLAQGGGPEYKCQYWKKKVPSKKKCWKIFKLILKNTYWPPWNVHTHKHVFHRQYTQAKMGCVIRKYQGTLNNSPEGAKLHQRWHF
jgi:hypothetical protein